ncbi:MAG: DNA helicase RecG, partial [Chloroflexia bacterium]|nr:DNA helicase RecG [Chloroflexia bacterium]
MQDRDHIISLGRLLAAELRRGCDDTAADQGLDHFLAEWQAQADGALDQPAVQATLALLADYGAQSVLERRARVTCAVEDLRGLFRQEVAPSPPSPPKKKRTRAPVAPPQPPAPVRTAADLALTDPLELVPGIERRDVAAFRRLGLKTVEDLLYHVPHRYDDFSSQHGIADLEVDAVGTIIAEVSEVRLIGSGSRSRVEVTFSDTSGSIRAVFFNQPWLPKQLTVGRQ